MRIGKIEVRCALALGKMCTVRSPNGYRGYDDDDDDDNDDVINLDSNGM